MLCTRYPPCFPRDTLKSCRNAIVAQYLLRMAVYHLNSPVPLKVRKEWDNKFVTQLMFFYYGIALREV